MVHCCVIDAVICHLFWTRDVRSWCFMEDVICREKPCLRWRIRLQGIDVAFKDTHMSTVNSHHCLFWRCFPWWCLLVCHFFSWSDAHPQFDSGIYLDRSARVVNQEVLDGSWAACFSCRSLLLTRQGSAVHVIRCQRRGKTEFRGSNSFSSFRCRN